jgi:hypothetical protein
MFGLGFIGEILKNSRKNTTLADVVFNKDLDLKKKLKNIPSVSSSVDKKEFELRYKNLTLSLYVVFAFAVFSCSVGFASSDLVSVFFGFLSSLICCTYLFRFSFRAWRARKTYYDWDNRDKPNNLTIINYIDILTVTPTELFPKKLK